MISRNKGLIARLGLLGPFVQREPDCRYIHGENEHIGENYGGTATMRRRQATPLLLPLVRCFTGPLDPLTLHESTAYMSVIPTEVEGSRPVLGVHARISARPRQPGEARGSRLRAVDGARSLHFGRDDRICRRSYKAPAFMPDIHGSVVPARLLESRRQIRSERLP